MPTVITDKTDFDSIEDIINQFENDSEVDIYSSKMSTIDHAIAMGQIEIDSLSLTPTHILSPLPLQLASPSGPRRVHYG
ncbi:hypothetical protein KIH41_01045 [Litoribacter ruber]|uniref:hypothetical protein n=1 Tax=Litoribacter ruber TaxID=702568 RepID=UPI001BD95DB8|nr:hypothetical protein [Litoribacter ruber]MBT0809861.1 hypothetical protein [Litoribacter ruber]